MTQQHDIAILLVDDEPRLLSALKRRLGRDFKIYTANGGPQALDLLATHTDVGVILADMQMPEMNGLELLRQVKSNYPAIKRLMLTGNSDQETAIGAINEGQVYRFLRKPCDTDDLKSALHQAREDFIFQNETSTPLAHAEDGLNAKKAFLSMMSHELRTPLNQILGMASALEVMPEGDDGKRDCINHIRESGNHLLKQINRILAFSRLRAESEIDECEETNLNGLLEDVVDSMQPSAAAAQVTISIEFTSARTPVYGRDSDIKLAVEELLSNAIKFNRENGHISLLVKADNDRVALRILDSGVGMEQDDISKTVEAFRQADESLSRSYEGIGLGLALVSAIAHVNQFGFSIEPKLGLGTAVTLSFKNAQSADAAVEIN